MLTVRLPNEVEERMAVLSQKTGRSKSYYVRKAIEGFLDEEEDYLLALSYSGPHRQDNFSLSLR